MGSLAKFYAVLLFGQFQPKFPSIFGWTYFSRRISLILGEVRPPQSIFGDRQKHFGQKVHKEAKKSKILALRLHVKNGAELGTELCTDGSVFPSRFRNIF